MRVVPAWALLAVLVFSPWTIMAQRFDVVTYTAPPGWTQLVQGDVLVFEMRPAGPRSSCQILVRKSRKAEAPLSQELDRTWAEWHAGRSVAVERPDPGQLDLPGGLRLAQRLGLIDTGTGAMLTMMNLFQKDDRIVTAVANTSREAFERCSTAIGDFLASLRIDPTQTPTASTIPKSDPGVAAKFNNSVVRTWRYAAGNVDPTKTVLSTTYYEVDVRFAPDGTYRITTKFETESGTYQVKEQQILMRPQAGGKAPYTLDWFFGDLPGSPGNSGLILRCPTSHWLGSFAGSATGWRPFKPAQ
jgi:hypothetical protein